MALTKAHAVIFFLEQITNGWFEALPYIFVESFPHGV